MFRELETKIGRMSWILLVLSDRRGVPENHTDARVVRGNQGVGRILGEERQDTLAAGDKFRKGGESKRVVPVAAVGSPFQHLGWIQRCLRSRYRRTAQTGGLTANRVLRLRIGKIIVKRKPQTGTGASGTASGADTGFVDISFGRLATHKLEGARSIVQWRFHRWIAVGGAGRDETVIDGEHRDTRLEQGFNVDGFVRDPLLTARLPAPARECQKLMAWVPGIPLSKSRVVEGHAPLNEHPTVWAWERAPHTRSRTPDRLAGYPEPAANSEAQRLQA